MFLAIKELTYNKSRYSLIMSILVLLLFLVLFLAGLANGLSSATSSAIDNAAATHYVISDDADDLITRSQLTPAQVDEVQSVNSTATPINLQRTTFRQSTDDKKMDITYLAVDPTSFMMPKVVEGVSPAETQTSDEIASIVLDNSFQDDGFKIGDILIDSASEVELKVSGFTENQMYGHSQIGVLSQETYQRMRQVTTRQTISSYNAVAIENDDVSNLPKESTLLFSKSEIISKIPGHAQEQSTIIMILVVLLVISAVILGVFFYVLTIQKITQFGVLKALGMSMGMLAKTLIYQVFLLASISVVLGSGITFLLASFLPNSMPFTLKVSDAVFVSIAFVVISIVSSLFSLRKVAKVDPLSAIGGNE